MLISPPKPMIRLKLVARMMKMPIRIRAEAAYSMARLRAPPAPWLLGRPRRVGHRRQAGAPVGTGPAPEFHPLREEHDGDEQEGGDEERLPARVHHQHAELLEDADRHRGRGGPED